MGEINVIRIHHLSAQPRVRSFTIFPFACLGFRQDMNGFEYSGIKKVKTTNDALICVGIE